MNKVQMTMLKKQNTCKNSISILSYVKVEVGRAESNVLDSLLTWKEDKSDGLYYVDHVKKDIWNDARKADPSCTFDKFPVFERPEGKGIKIDLPGNVFLEAVPFVSDDETRHFMCGVYIGYDHSDCPVVVATNGQRMYVSDREAKMDENYIILPASPAVVQAVKDRARMTVIPYENKDNTYHAACVVFDADDYTLTIRSTVEGQYPNFPCVIPDYKKPCDVFVKIPPKETLKKWASLFSKRKCPWIMYDNTLGLWSVAPEKKNPPVDTFGVVTSSSLDFILTLNPRYLLEDGADEVYFNTEALAEARPNRQERAYARRAILRDMPSGGVAVIMPMMPY